ncbi:enoyl-CoA-hydratase DpgB [Streptomyces desertarenae]|uniref:Enoyl-CoA-hydratase DpgB n=1 Tax=Streptomyces desertarenae TaxID=2666184 RepID=A0ABW4PQ44_9ACTN
MEDALTLVIDGTEPPSAATAAAVQAFCDAAEDQAGSGAVVLRVSGAPAEGWTSGLDVTVVNKWERALRRLERLARATVAIASGDCGGAALDVFVACDIRVVTPDTRLLVARDAAATWPGMAGFRLVQLAGAARVRRALLFGEPIEATAALRTGLADEMTEDLAGALATAVDLVGGLAGAEISIRRQLHFDAATTSFDEALGQHLAACDRVLRTPVKVA